jgi:hypothetical protein
MASGKPGSSRDHGPTSRFKLACMSHVDKALEALIVSTSDNWSGPNARKRASRRSHASCPIRRDDTHHLISGQATVEGVCLLFCSVLLHSREAFSPFSNNTHIHDKRLKHISPVYAMYVCDLSTGIQEVLGYSTKDRTTSQNLLLVLTVWFLLSYPSSTTTIEEDTACF